MIKSVFDGMVWATDRMSVGVAVWSSSSVKEKYLRLKVEGQGRS